jgi:hypothetical protein
MTSDATPPRTEIAIDGRRFLLNGRPTYAGLRYRDRPLDGLLFNARMVQAVFDDDEPRTRSRWAYPDTGRWDADRNTAEFCAMLPEYRRHGLLAVTVGLQGGGSIYTDDVYPLYHNNAYEPDGRLRPAWFARLARVLAAADAAGMVVIVNYFYFYQARRFADEAALLRATEETTAWLLATGHRNILVDVANESGKHWSHEICRPARVHELITRAQALTHEGRRLLVSASGWAFDDIPHGPWLACGDMAMPHGNDCTPARLAAKVERMCSLDEYRRHPRPVLINEDSIFIDNLEECAVRGWSWGYYSQGHGSGLRDSRMDWSRLPRESDFAALSGYQTIPINWGIYTAEKQAFFRKLAEITGAS